MKYMTKVYLWRWLALAGALSGFGGILMLQRLVFVVTLHASTSMIVIGMIFTGLAYFLSWVLCSMYKSNRDTAFDEMGNLEQEMYLAKLTQAIADRRGDGTIR